MEYAPEYFDIYPLVFPADKEAVINVKPLFEQVDYTPMLYPNKGQEILDWATGNDTPFEVIDDGMCELLNTFPGRGMAIFEKYWAGK